MIAGRGFRGRLVLRRRPLGQHGLGLVVVLIALTVVAAAVAGGLTAFFLLKGKAHPSEQTARFFPADTEVYLSLNLRPGNDQLKRFRDILERFRQEPLFEEKIDEFIDDTGDETGIDLAEDILPWLGPEVAIGVVDVVGSFIAVTGGGRPLVLALIGTSDPERSNAALGNWIEYQELEADLEFRSTTYRSSTVFREMDEGLYYAATREYILFSTDGDLLEETIDRILDGDVDGSLYANPRFQEVRATLPSPRFTTLYAASEAIWKDARRQFGEEIPDQLRQQLDDFIPDWMALTGSFIDMGVKLELSYASPEGFKEVSIPVTSAASAGMLPSDTLAFLSFGIDYDGIKSQLDEQRVADLGPDVHEVLTSELGVPLDDKATLRDVGDELFDSFEEAFGLDLERDFLDWITGEFSFALLPTDFRGLADDPSTVAVEAAAFIGFDPENRAEIIDFMRRVVDLVEDNLGVSGEPVSYGEVEGVVFDLQNLTEPTPYRPGYLVLDDHLVVATTASSLQVVASVQEGRGNALDADGEYSRLLKDVSGPLNPIFYADVGQIVDGVTAILDPEEREDYEENVAPFIQPLRAFLLTAETRPEGVSRVYFTLTFE